MLGWMNKMNYLEDKINKYSLSIQIFIGVFCIGFIIGIFYMNNNTPKLKIDDALYELEQTYPPPEYSGHEIIQYKNGKWYQSRYRGQ